MCLIQKKEDSNGTKWKQLHIACSSSGTNKSWEKSSKDRNKKFSIGWLQLLKQGPAANARAITKKC